MKKSKFNTLFESVIKELFTEEEELHGEMVKQEEFDGYEITIFESPEKSYMYHISKDGEEIAREDGKFETIEAAIQAAKEYIDEHKED